MVELPCLSSSAEMAEGTTWQAAFVMSISFARLSARLFGDELLDGDRREARIADVLVHVGVGEFLGLDHDVEGIDGVMAILGHAEVLHDIEHGERGDALAVGRKFIDGPATVGSGDGLDPLGLEVAEVFEGVSPTVGIEELDHRLSHGTFVESIAAMLGDLAKRAGESGVLEQVARLRSTRPDVVGLFIAGLVQKLLAIQYRALRSARGNPFCA